MKFKGKWASLNMGSPMLGVLRKVQTALNCDQATGVDRGFAHGTLAGAVQIRRAETTDEQGKWISEPSQRGRPSRECVAG